MADQQDVFEPDQSIIDNAWVSDWKTLEEKAKADPVAYWEERARELEWVEAVGQDPRRFRQALLQVVHRFQDEHRHQCGGPSPRYRPS